METLDLTKILAGCPEGTPLYSPLFGEVIFQNVSQNVNEYAIKVKSLCTKADCSFTADGRYYDSEIDGECMLFPSRDCRDWSQFKQPQQFHSGDHILWRNNTCNEFLGVFDRYTEENQGVVRLLRGNFDADCDIYIKDLTKVKKFDQKWLKPGDAVLVRDCNIVSEWMYSTFSHISFEEGKPYYIASCSSWEMCVPYNSETKHLLGTTDDATEFYKI